MKTDNTSVAFDYFIWLCHLVLPKHEINIGRSYTTICELMHKIPFLNLVDYDGNRIAQASELRTVFVNDQRLGPMEGVDMLFPDASMLEVLVGIAKQADFMVGKGQIWWFDTFIRNLGLQAYTDDRMVPGRSTWHIERKLNLFNQRRYEQNGRGGIFPLLRPNKDQREVELWYQMGEYMTANNLY